MSTKQHITVRLTPEQYCKNCQGIVYSKFCSDCGQRHHEGRLSFGVLFEEFVANFLMLDSASLRTIIGIIQPGKVVTEYLSGKRKKYMKPISFFLLFLVLYLYLFSFIDPNPEVDFFIGETGFAYSFSRSINWFSHELKMVQLLTIPLCAQYSFYAFKDWEYNYFEHVTIWLYLSAYSHFSAIITICAVLFLNFFFPLFEHAFSISILLSSIYFIFGLVQVFHLFSLKGFIKVLWTAIYCFILIILLITFGVGLIFSIIDYFFINPIPIR